MPIATVLLCLLAAADGVERDPDSVAPFLGLTSVDAEDLARDALDPLVERTEPRAAEPAPSAAPIWAAFLPSLSIEVSRREARLLSGVERLGLGSGTVLFVAATFGVGGEEVRGGPDSRERGAAGLQLTRASATASIPTPAVDPARPLPSIAEVQRATERAALVRLEDLDGWRTRARASAWLPELGASYQRNVGEIDTLGIQSNLGIDSHNLEDVTRYGVKATWQLSQLIFSREEVAAARAALEVQRERQLLIAHVTELYFEWLRLRSRLAAAAEGEREAAGLALAEVTAKIDALTDGFLSRRMSGQP